MKEAIEQILKTDNNVYFGYLFGSYAKGDATARSDIDIAVYLDDISLDARRYLTQRPRYTTIASFRNFLAHDYEKSDKRIICKETLAKLDDISTYLQYIEKSL